MADLTKKILLGLGFGAAVVTPLAITYYYLSRDENLMQELKQDRRKQNGKKEQKQIFLTIRSDAVGAVIGKGGEVVRRIQDETNTRIDFKEEKGRKGDKTATITGSPDAILDAEAYIHRIIAEQPITYQETIYVRKEMIGRIIGKDGEVIRSIGSDTDTRIDIARDVPFSSPGHPITIKGTIENIRIAKNKIEEIADSGRKSRNSFNKSRSNSFKNQRKSFSPKTNGTSSSPETEELVPTQDGYLHVYVSTAKSPSKFWVQVFGTKSNELDKLTEAMTDFYESKDNFKACQLTDIKIGDIIAAPFNMDESWYRVRVVSLENDQVHVYYLDFGDVSVHSKDSVCSLKPEYVSALPFQAVECSLFGVNPIEGEEWSDEATKVFCDLTHAGNWIELKAAPIEKNGSTMLVELLDFKDLSWPINVADEMISKGFASRSIQD